MRISDLVEEIKKAGEMALESQGRVERLFKFDGSVVTSVDYEINRRLSTLITKKYLDANLITEEEASCEYDPAREYTFVLDPLDGTDTYSMGMPGWCIALGLLRNLEPVAGIVYAPSWGCAGGSLLVAEEEGGVTLNGRALECGKSTMHPLQVMAPSSAHRYFDYSGFAGKVRNSGSSIISMSAIVLHSQISGAVINTSYIWDIAASHAIIKKLGFELEYMKGGRIDYSMLTDRSTLRDFAVCGTPDAVAEIRKTFLYRR